MLSKNLAAAYVASVITLAGMDLLWLGIAARDFYQNRLGHLLGKEVHWWAAGIFYALYAAGVLFFATAPAIEKDSLVGAALRGGLLGLLTYAAYNLTNLALLKDWPADLAAADTLWGIIITSSVSMAGFLASRRLF